MENELKLYGNLTGKYEIAGRIYDARNISPCIPVFGGGELVKIAIPQIENQSAAEFIEGPKEKTPVRVRKLTPKECWRLMGFDDDSFERAAAVVSKSQLYKQAGNSIVVDVLMAIFKEML